MQSYLTKQFTALHQKLGDVLHLGSVTHHCALKGVPLYAGEQAQCATYATHWINVAGKFSPSKN